ncbi:hypothetical protein CLV24_10328 [Pontibacter ummariensis]|uniref:Lipoprotein n=1 Tax=Pontibacter ummariensis TaxID=1610492 RepID=A0A239CVW1_9BACT|nr:hypothetical protein [Pontibacter ummariensis]PRY14791.1 hypothetical protein CLV24_10328 [Pontibacter ummariensis]SNS24386.1 hypothetical protein SAMN06296052_103285 [Pontibacter ummariensis]
MKKSFLMATLAAVLVLPACSVPHMAVEPAFMQKAEELPVAGRTTFRPSGNFNIGDFTVANVDRGWRRMRDFSIFSYHNIDAKQQYQFSLQDGQGEEWYVFGASRLHDKSLRSNTGVTIDVSPNREYYASHFTSPESGDWHLLTVDPGDYLRRNKFEGEVSNGRTTYTISPVYKFEGRSLPMSEIIGYEFMNGDEVVGAVQVINNGKAWLLPDLPRDIRMVLASAMASLLLYEKLDEPVENFEP